MVDRQLMVLIKGAMGHDWIFEVLTDLRSYALANGLPALAAKTEEALRVARAEISASEGPAGAKGGGSAPSNRQH